MAYKPGSVPGIPGDGHSSRTAVAGGLARPTRATGWKHAYAAPIWSCSGWGLPCRFRYRSRGALLPHPFTLTLKNMRFFKAVCFLWHCPWGRPRRVLPGTLFPWSPDFPPPTEAGSDRPAIWRYPDTRKNYLQQWLTRRELQLLWRMTKSPHPQRRSYWMA
jgi:hypothetical protein